MIHYVFLMSTVLTVLSGLVALADDNEQAAGVWVLCFLSLMAAGVVIWIWP